MHRKSYGCFAEFYDILMSEAGYTAAGERIDSLILKHRGKRGILLDVACGTGTMCEFFAKKGYDVIGTDISEQMLSKAFEKKMKSGLPVQYLCQDMRELDMFGTIDAAVCTFDSLNHLSSPEDIMRTFRKVSLFSEPGGIFIFDVNTPFKHDSVLGDNSFVYDTDRVCCVWQNFLKGGELHKVDIRLDFFVPEDDNGRRYFRETENFSEIALPVGEISRMLEKAGFEVTGIFDGYTNKPLCDTSQRAVFCARKRN